MSIAILMSQETAGWLNTMTLITFTDQRGHAWHYRASKQGAESNHYPGPIPVEDVRRRLFNWRVAEGDVTSSAAVMDADGVQTFEVRDLTRKALLRPPGAFGADDQGAILGVFKSGYQGHDYEEWLLGQVAAILGDDLAIGSAGLLKGGAVAWVSVEVPESITTPEGVQFRPHLLATTSFDGSLSTVRGMGRAERNMLRAVQGGAEPSAATRPRASSRSPAEAPGRPPTAAHPTRPPSTRAGASSRAHKHSRSRTTSGVTAREPP